MYVITITKWKKKLAWVMGVFILCSALVSGAYWWKSFNQPVMDDLEDEVLSEPLKVQTNTIKK